MQKAKMVLVIEPEMGALRLIGQKLGDVFDIVAVSSRADAIAKMRSDKYCLVTTPLVPATTLTAFIDAVRKMQPRAKIILAGGFPMAAKEYRVDGFVQKPDMHGLAKLASDLIGAA
jgi:hypothetical protein